MTQPVSQDTTTVYALRVLPQEWLHGSVEAGRYYKNGFYYGDDELEETDEYVKNLGEATFFSTPENARNEQERLAQAVKLEVVPVTLTLGTN